MMVKELMSQQVGIVSINDLALHVGGDWRGSAIPPEAIAAPLTGVSLHGHERGS